MNDKKGNKIKQRYIIQLEDNSFLHVYGGGNYTIVDEISKATMFFRIEDVNWYCDELISKGHTPSIFRVDFTNVLEEWFDYLSKQGTIMKSLIKMLKIGTDVKTKDYYEKLRTLTKETQLKLKTESGIDEVSKDDPLFEDYLNIIRCTIIPIIANDNTLSKYYYDNLFTLQTQLKLARIGNKAEKKKITNADRDNLIINNANKVQEILKKKEEENQKDLTNVLNIKVTNKKENSNFQYAFELKERLDANKNINTNGLTKNQIEILQNEIDTLEKALKESDERFNK